MKRPVLIIRLGKGQPIQADYPVISSLTNGSMNAIGIGSSAGMITVVMTDMEPQEISDLFKEVHDPAGNIMPHVILRMDDPNAAYFFEDTHVQESINHFYQTEWNPNAITMSLDELLDKVKRVGVKGLKPEELARLKSLS
jgi:hypothetical protein